VRAQERLRALGVGLFDVDQEAEQGRLASTARGASSSTSMVIAGAAIHAKRVGDAGHDEEQADVRVGKQVAQ
jgi:hypothetical protein